jgi:hypothetical protein
MSNSPTLILKAYGIAGFTVASIIAAVILRSIQFGQVDPYDNPYTNISSLLILVFIAGWLTLTIVVFRHRVAFVGAKFIPLWAMIGLGFLWITWFLGSLFLIVFAG